MSFSIKGKYAEAMVYTDLVESEAMKQVHNMLNQPITENTKVAMMPDIHAGKGATIGTTIKFQGENVEDWKISPNVVGVDLGCLDAETEYLTKDGWKKIDSYDGKSEILIYDTVRDMSYFEKPEAYIVKECDEFNYFKNSKGLDQMVCDEHNMLVFSGYKSRGYTKKFIHPNELNTLSLKNGYHGFKTSYSLCGGGLDYSDSEIKLIAMISADATYRGVTLGDSHAYELHLVKQRKIDRTLEVLNSNNIKYKIYNSKVDDSVYITFNTKKLYSKNLLEFYEASKEQLKILYEESLLWDGHVNEKDSYYTTTSKINADVMQFAINSNDIRAGLYTTKYDKEEWKDCYSVRLTKNNVIGYSEKSERVPSLDGFKYCFTVSTSAFVARRNNKVFLTGNCGIAMIPLKEEEVDLDLLDKVVSKWIPAGHSVNETVTQKNRDFVEQSVLNKLKISLDDKVQARIIASLGTLGGGNHYIELGRDETGLLWLSVHSGSRNLGVQVAKTYQEKAEKYLESLYLGDTKETIAELVQQGRQQEIQGELQKRKEEVKGLQKDLAFLSPEDVQDYLHDSKLAQEYAAKNRSAMLEEIISRMGLTKLSFSFDSVHNYVDVEQKIIRKGATSARSGQLLVIPLNMRDGSLICVGKGSEAWNFSAPHGAGRVLSRSAARKELSLEEYQKQMEGVHTSSVGSSTIDEAPNAYKPKEEILQNIKETAIVVRTVKPIWNFKAH